MKRDETTKLKVKQGCIVVNPYSVGIVVSERIDIVLIEVDLVSKYAETGGFISGGSDDSCGVFLMKNKATMYTNKSMKNATLILFEDYPGYRVFSANVFRYTLCATLIQRG